MAQNHLVNQTVSLYSGNTFGPNGLPIFYSGAEFQLHRVMGRELIERLINQRIELYRVDTTLTESNFYGESSKKTFLPPVTLPCRIQVIDRDPIFEGGIRKRKKRDIEAYVYNDYLEDLGIVITIGDFFIFDDKFYEISNVTSPPLYRLDPDRNDNQTRSYYKRIDANSVESSVFSGR